VNIIQNGVFYIVQLHIIHLLNHQCNMLLTCESRVSHYVYMLSDK